MRISVASGKGGTGKTTLSVNMALALSDQCSVTLADFDVEEPDCINFLDMRTDRICGVELDVPVFDENKCTHCGKCAEFCRYNAIAVLKERVMHFPELCNGCGGCSMVCPVDAVSYSKREIGEVRGAERGNLTFVEGILKTGEAKAVPVIDELQERMGEGIIIMDSPPGTSCPMMSTVRGSDLCILVTEPTPFGLNDLDLAVEAVREIGVDHGIVINRSGKGDHLVERFAEKKGIDILLRIPQDRDIANMYSDGIPFVDERKDIAEQLVELYNTVKEGRN